ncbi:STAS domain-containing protein [Streptosporangium sp. KLBMP 9127]|nr:STAS domain-containing protein [Streptosporangium sp. KLBMP 9127]
MGLEFDGALLRIRVTAEPPGLRVEGEVDLNNLAAFTESLTEAVKRMPGDVHLDLAELSFIDLAGLRVIADTATALCDGRNLVLAPVAPHVHHLIKMIGWDATPGLRLAGEEVS